MHRIRAGVTGLGLVFLITLIGSIALAPSGRDSARDEPGEPLAELGVAPSPGDRASAPDVRLPPDLPPVAGSERDAERPIAGRRGETGRPEQVVI